MIDYDGGTQNSEVRYISLILGEVPVNARDQNSAGGSRWSV
jgi:hypothetical protein